MGYKSDAATSTGRTAKNRGSVDTPHSGEKKRSDQPRKAKKTGRPARASESLAALICRVIGHRWHFVYREPWTQHPVSVTREHPTKTETICGTERPYLEIKTRCYRCKRTRWI